LLTIAGFQVPVIPFVEDDGNNGAVAFAQIEETIVKIGVIVLTFIFKVAVVAQMPGVGVTV
jgi:hypothetical protein